MPSIVDEQHRSCTVWVDIRTRLQGSSPRVLQSHFQWLTRAPVPKGPHKGPLHVHLPQSMANNYGAFVSTVPAFLNVVDFAHRLVGPKPLQYLSGAMNRMSNHLVPAWNPYMPRVRLWTHHQWHCH